MSSGLGEWMNIERQDSSSISNREARPYSINIGEIALSSSAMMGRPSVPTGFQIDRSQVSADGASAELLLSWDWDDRVWYYDIYRKQGPQNGSRLLWLGRISADSYYVRSMPRVGTETSALVQLVAVEFNGEETQSRKATALFSWLTDYIEPRFP